jgi:RNA polymerase sigma-70 factor (ECF subfamily)
MSTLPSTDEQLMRQLYTEHAGLLLAYVRRLVGGDTARAEDVVQETLLRAWQHPDALVSDDGGHARIRAWLLTVARHLVVDGERARRARPREVGGMGLAADGTSGAVRFDDAGFDRVLLAHGVADALDTLTQEHRTVIENLYFADRSVTDTARELDIPEGTVKSRAYYALRALRVACEEREILP